MKSLKINFLNSVFVALILAAGVAYAQDTLPPQARPSLLPTKKEPINIGCFPKTVNFAPDESNLIVTACTDTLSDGMGLDVVPNLLPSVGFKYDADGFNLASGAPAFAANEEFFRSAA